MTRAGLVLASASPRRRALLEAAGLAFSVRPAEIDEEAYLNGAARAAALKTALAKANAVAAECPAGTCVIGADTMVVIGDDILNKPVDREEARRMLEQLSGATHRVVTAIAVLHVGGASSLDVEVAGVTFHDLGDELIAKYIESGEADDKAGAYGIQGLGAQFVREVQGDLTGVIGLPLGRLREGYLQLFDEDLFEGCSLREVAMGAFPELQRLPEGVPGRDSRR